MASVRGTPDPLEQIAWLNPLEQIASLNPLESDLADWAADARPGRDRVADGQSGMFPC